MSVRLDSLESLHSVLLFASSVELRPLKQLVEGVVPLPERERCGLLLAAVNGDALSYADWKRLLGRPLRGGGTRSVRAPAEVRGVFRPMLERLTEDQRAAIAEYGQRVSKIADDETFIAKSHRVKDGNVEVLERVVASSALPALCYALTLFFDPTLPFGYLLRCCAWSECRLFAFAEPPSSVGQPPVYCCSEEHRRRYKLEQGKKRAAAWRLSRR